MVAISGEKTGGVVSSKCAPAYTRAMNAVVVSAPHAAGSPWSPLASILLASEDDIRASKSK
ncbi:hypothetical protein E2562_001171 [Oryza meyeriana var. granulata]|uniref:Uncharacterized protein n=1 Tax=Oryza meyeriana var. granulata TaxID=110450 RepID=A0A6G1DBV8_9ORYZ|nr:hypothetical protein E2562_001171 [Oryza meyeriana var. granulata]